jgi:hypothetical protein
MDKEGERLVNLSKENAEWNRTALEIARQRLAIVTPQPAKPAKAAGESLPSSPKQDK